jgi:invasion protein IalB
MRPAKAALLMSIRSFVVFCVMLLTPQAVLAQSKSTPSKPAPPPAKPAAVTPNAESQITTTSYGDWALQCQRGAEGTRENCEVSLTIQEKNQPAPIAKIALGRPVPTENIHVLVLLPNNVSFPSSVEMRSDDKDVWSADIPWRRCVPGACFAEMTLTDADVVRWHALDGAGKIQFKDAQANQIGIGFSFHGLGQALDALVQKTQ